MTFLSLLADAQQSRSAFNHVHSILWATLTKSTSGRLTNSGQMNAAQGTFNDVDQGNRLVLCVVQDPLRRKLNKKDPILSQDLLYFKQQYFHYIVLYHVFSSNGKFLMKQLKVMQELFSYLKSTFRQLLWKHNLNVPSTHMQT